MDDNNHRGERREFLQERVLAHEAFQEDPEGFAPRPRVAAGHGRWPSMLYVQAAGMELRSMAVQGRAVSETTARSDRHNG